MTNDGGVDFDKIVGGANASPHEFPWQVGIVMDNEWFCGGTLISNN
jgi:secreted trypsin-like serine protease